MENSYLTEYSAFYLAVLVKEFLFYQGFLSLKFKIHSIQTNKYNSVCGLTRINA